MIFGRKRAERAAATPDEESDPAAEVSSAEAEADPATDPPAAPGNESEPDHEPGLDLAALDAAQWRDDGPFDVTELHDSNFDDAGPDEPDSDHPDSDHPDSDHPDSDLVTDEDEEQPRIDLGSIILTGVPGSELRLQVTEDTQEIVSAMLILPDEAGPDADGSAAAGALSSSALELSAFAAPRSGGLWAELREEIAEAAISAGGSASLGEGPFGVELRRLVPVTTPEGDEGYQPSRMWVAEGPRWMLRGIVYGSAAIEEDLDRPVVAAVIAAFRSVVVRRGDEAMAPGDLLPFTMPGDLTSAS